jgi:putative ubiquitin-RnfH superfamily antitoxin RatB of RatAB toxin-antitoxin module
MSNKIEIEVVYGLPDEQTLLRCSVDVACTAVEAVQQSSIMEKHPEIDLSKNKLGIFGKLIKADTALHDKDRIEIYRPLLADPKEVRRRRAAEGKVMKKGGGSA